MCAPQLSHPGLRVSLTPWQRAGIALGAFCGAMLGAKLPFVFADWEGLLSGRAWFDNGKTIMFGMVGGYFGVELAKPIVGVRLKTGDSFAVPVAVAVAIGRIACFTAGCCFGRETTLPWGVDFGDGLRRHPTQLYETAFHLAAASVLAALQRRGMFRGQLIKLYISVVLRLSLCDRAHSPRTQAVARPDRLPMGGAQRRLRISRIPSRYAFGAKDL